MFVHGRGWGTAAIVVVLVACGDRTVTPEDEPVELADPGRIAVTPSVVCYLESGEVRCAGLPTAALGRVPEREYFLPGDTADLGGDALRISAGGGYFCAWLEGDTLECWGDNDFGQLGVGHSVDIGAAPGDMGDALVAVDLGTDFRLAQLATGSTHACALSTEGRVKCWGSNTDGALGLGDEEHRGDEPGDMGDALPYVDLGSGVRAQAITAGGRFTCVLSTGGRVKCWGGNAYGQLGLGDTENRGATPSTMGDALPFVDLGPVPVVQLSAGASHVCALLEDGGLLCWGRAAMYPNESPDCFEPMVCEGPPQHGGRLGLGDMEHRGDDPGEMGAALPRVELDVGEIATVHASDLHTCVLDVDGAVTCWGDARDGRLGLGDEADRGDQPGEMGMQLPSLSLPLPALAMDASLLQTCAIFEDGVRCWGSVPDYWDLGDGETLVALHLGDEAGEIESLDVVPGL